MLKRLRARASAALKIHNSPSKFREEAIIIRRVIENDAFHDERIGSLKMPAAGIVWALMTFFITKSPQK